MSMRALWWLRAGRPPPLVRFLYRFCTVQYAGHSRARCLSRMKACKPQSFLLPVSSAVNFAHVPSVLGGVYVWPLDG